MKVDAAETSMLQTEELAKTLTELPRVTTDKPCDERMNRGVDANGKIYDLVLDSGGCRHRVIRQNLPNSWSQIDLGSAVFDQFLSQVERL
jgi:hypothetical protein